MAKENSPDRLRLVETEDIIFCPKCSRKNKKDAIRCIDLECGFPLKDAILTKVIPIQFLKGGEENGSFN